MTGLTGLESSELRNKVGANIVDGSIVYLNGVNIDPTPALRHAGMPVHLVLAEHVLAHLAPRPGLCLRHCENYTDHIHAVDIYTRLLQSRLELGAARMQAPILSQPL